MRPRKSRIVATAALAVLALAGCAARSAGPPVHVAHVSTSSSSTTTSSSSTTTTSGPPPSTSPPLPDTNPAPGVVVTPNANYPDPFVMPVKGGYELFVSQTGFSVPPVRVAFSKSVTSWPAPAAAMTTVPKWAENGFTWSPDVHLIARHYVMYFNAWATQKLYVDENAYGFARRAQCIGTATSKSRAGPFTPSPQPLVCRFQDHGAIDPRMFTAPNGSMWLDWKTDDNALAPAPFPPTSLYAERLKPTGLAFAGPPHLLLRADASWQQGILEAPQMLYQRGSYWLFYSGGWFNNSTYGIGFARCKGPTGPCFDHSMSGPWVGSNGNGSGPGEQSLFEDHAGRWWMVYAPWFEGFEGHSDRPVAITGIGFHTTGPYLAKN